MSSKLLVLRQRKKETKELKFGTFDIETDKELNPIMIGWYEGTKYYESKNIEDFLAFIEQDKKNTNTWFAHFGGRFDFLLILEKIDFRAEWFESGGRIIQLKFKFGKNIVRLIDSYGLLPDSLYNLGKAFNVSIEKNIDVTDLNNNTPGLSDYLKNDVVGLYEIILRFEFFINRLGGNVKTTIGSTAMDIFLRNYYNGGLMAVERLYNEMRSAYYGGRNEVFKTYGTNIYQYDYNSMFPYAMLNNFPVGSPIEIKGMKTANEDGIYEIETYIEPDVLPPLPIKEPGQGTIFKSGALLGWYPKPYLELLNKLGISYKINRAIIFNSRPIFKNYVLDLYEIKKNETGAMRLIAKLLLNSLYGKFGQRPVMRKYLYSPGPEDFQRYELRNYSAVYDIWYYEKFNLLPYSIPQIAAYVTAYANCKLYWDLAKYDTYYCDTDSIFTGEQLETGNEIGQLKLEEFYKEVVFLDKKFYAGISESGQEIIKIKGLKNNKPTFKDFKLALIKGYYYNVVVERFATFRELINDRRFIKKINVNQMIEMRARK